MARRKDTRAISLKLKFLREKSPRFREVAAARLSPPASSQPTVGISIGQIFLVMKDHLRANARYYNGEMKTL